MGECCGDTSITESWEPTECPFCSHPDTIRLAYLCSGAKTDSNALVEIQLKLLNGEFISLNEFQKAINEAMNNPLIENV